MVQEEYRAGEPGGRLVKIASAEEPCQGSFRPPTFIKKSIEGSRVTIQQPGTELTINAKTIGHSCPSSCRKTTLACIRQRVFRNSAYSPTAPCVLHAGDSCKGFDQTPTFNGYLDCDGSDDNAAHMARFLDHLKSKGTNAA